MRAVPPARGELHHVLGRDLLSHLISHLLSLSPNLHTVNSCQLCEIFIFSYHQDHQTPESLKAGTKSRQCVSFYDLQTQTDRVCPGPGGQIWDRREWLEHNMHSMHSMLRLGGSIFVVVLKPTLCLIPSTLAGWLRKGSGQLRCVK